MNICIYRCICICICICKCICICVCVCACVWACVCILYIVYCVLYILYVVCCILYVVCCILYVVYCMLYVVYVNMYIYIYTNIRYIYIHMYTHMYLHQHIICIMYIFALSQNPSWLFRSKILPFWSRKFVAWLGFCGGSMCHQQPPAVLRSFCAMLFTSLFLLGKAWRTKCFTGALEN